MSDRLLLPPRPTDVEDGSPMVFLAGPIQGAPDWQTPTAHKLLAAHDRLLVASPRRVEMDKEFNKREQVFWELDHIWTATQLGGVAFWFAAKDESLAYEEGRMFAQTSRCETWAASVVHKFDPLARSWIGFDPNYESSGGGSEEYIQLMREWATGDTTFYEDLDEMIGAISEDVADL